MFLILAVRTTVVSFSLLHIQSSSSSRLPPHLASSPPPRPAPSPSRSCSFGDVAATALHSQFSIASALSLCRRAALLRYLVAAVPSLGVSSAALTAAAEPFACSFKCKILLLMKEKNNLKSTVSPPEYKAFNCYPCNSCPCRRCRGMFMRPANAPRRICV
jgi:hypothetical protein